MFRSLRVSTVRSLLLNIEDQIVLQAFANLGSEANAETASGSSSSRLSSATCWRSPTVCSSSVAGSSPMGAFQRRIRQHYEEGMRWVGDFDLAAFYDTISHVELLLRTIYPRTTNDDLQMD